MKRHRVSGDDPWDDERDEGPPAKLQRRRHRDPERTDERRELERRQHPRREERHGEPRDGSDG